MLGLGTVQFGLPYGVANRTGQVSVREAREMLAFALAHGVDTLDTAAGYGDSESVLGELGTTGFRIVTKLSEVPEGCGDVGRWVREQLHRSLERLRVDRVHGLLLHRPAQLLVDAGPALYDALLAAKASGLVGKIGVSVYSPSELDDLMDGRQFDLVQAPFNVFDRRLLTSGWLRRLKDMDVEVHTRSSFLQGLLLMPRASVPRKFWPWSEQLDAYHDWIEQSRYTGIEACMGFVTGFSDIDRVIVGADSVAQLEEIVRAVERVRDITVPDLGDFSEGLIDPSRWPSLPDSAGVGGQASPAANQTTFVSREPR